MNKEIKIGIELSDEELMDMIGGFTAPTTEVVDSNLPTITMKYGVKPTTKYGIKPILKYGVMPVAKYGVWYK